MFDILIRHYSLPPGHNTLYAVYNVQYMLYNSVYTTWSWLDLLSLIVTGGGVTCDQHS